MKKIVLFLSCILLCAHISAQHTFSIVAVDTLTGDIGTAGATCLSSQDCGGCGGAVVITGIVAGLGGMNAQASICIPNSNLNNGIGKITSGTTATQVLEELLAEDVCTAGGVEDRQYGIITMDEQGGIDIAGFTGQTNSPFAAHIIGPNYAIQGNILIGEEVLIGMENGFLNTSGTLAEKLMGAMQGAKIPGADSRCLVDGVSSKSSFLRLIPRDGVSNFRFMNLLVQGFANGVDPIDSLQTLFTQRFDRITNTDELNLRKEINIYPNPAEDLIVLEHEAINLNAQQQIKFFNSGGRLLKRSNLDSNQIDISDLPIGLVYFQIFNNNKDQILFGKFLIQR